MTDPRFSTECGDLQTLLDKVDVDDLQDIETFLMFLVHRPVGVDHLEDDDGEGAIEIRLWDDHGDVEGIRRFPLSLENLVLLCFESDDRLGPYTKAGSLHPRERSSLYAMNRDELTAAMTDALGKMRIFNLMNEKAE